MRHPRRGHSSVKAGTPVIIAADQALRSASVSSPCKNQRTTKKRQVSLTLISAGMVEMVDSEDLGDVTLVKGFAPSSPRTFFGKSRLACFYNCGSSVTLRLGSSPCKNQRTTKQRQRVLPRVLSGLTELADMIDHFHIQSQCLKAV